jgi:hypothetical protein
VKPITTYPIASLPGLPEDCTSAISDFMHGYRGNAHLNPKDPKDAQLIFDSKTRLKSLSAWARTCKTCLSQLEPWMDVQVYAQFDFKQALVHQEPVIRTLTIAKLYAVSLPVDIYENHLKKLEESGRNGHAIDVMVHAENELALNADTKKSLLDRLKNQGWVFDSKEALKPEQLSKAKAVVLSVLKECGFDPDRKSAQNQEKRLAMFNTLNRILEQLPLPLKIFAMHNMNQVSHSANACFNYPSIYATFNSIVPTGWDKEGLTNESLLTLLTFINSMSPARGPYHDDLYKKLIHFLGDLVKQASSKHRHWSKINDLDFLRLVIKVGFLIKGKPELVSYFKTKFVSRGFLTSADWKSLKANFTITTGDMDFISCLCGLQALQKEKKS